MGKMRIIMDYPWDFEVYPIFRCRSHEESALKTSGQRSEELLATTSAKPPRISSGGPSMPDSSITLTFISSPTRESVFESSNGISTTPFYGNFNGEHDDHPSNLDVIGMFSLHLQVPNPDHRAICAALLPRYWQ